MNQNRKEAALRRIELEIELATNIWPFTFLPYRKTYFRHPKTFQWHNCNPENFLTIIENYKR